MLVGHHVETVFHNVGLHILGCKDEIHIDLSALSAASCCSRLVEVVVLANSSPYSVMELKELGVTYFKL